MATASLVPDLDRIPRTGPAERERVLRVLRAEAAELRARGVRALSLFGSVARGEAGPTSDVDLLAAVESERGFSLLDLAALELFLEARLGRAVQVTTAGTSLQPRFQAKVERDSVKVFE